MIMMTPLQTLMIERDLFAFGSEINTERGGFWPCLSLRVIRVVPSGD